MNTKLYLIILALVCNSVFSQNRKKIETSVKLNVVQFNNRLFNKNEYIKMFSIINNDKLCKIEELKSKGFSDIIFYKVDYPDSFIDIILKLDLKRLDTEKIQDIIKWYNTEEFILAYNIKSEKVYKLKGFNINDYGDLVTEYWINLSDDDRKIFKNKKKFLENYYVEDLDLKCLYSCSKKRNNKKCKCMKPNMSREVEINGYKFKP